MSSEIVPALDGISETAKSDSNAFGIIRRPMEDIRAFDLLGLRTAWMSSVKVDLIGRNHHIRHFVAPEKGHKSVTQFDPTPASLKSLLEEMKEPSTLLLRGFDQLLLQFDFPFERFKTLTCLEISGVTNLTTLQLKTISEMTHLQSLNLSYLLIETLPERFSSGLVQLRLLNLRGCSKLRYLPSTEPLQLLEVLDLSHCTALLELEFWPTRLKLRVLDLSCTRFPRFPLHVINGLTHLFLRDAKLNGLLDLKSSTRTLEVLDISGAQKVKHIDLLETSRSHLVALDISRTDIGCIDFVSDMVQLRYLILRECTRLVKLPSMGKLENLEVLDMSGCETLGDLPEDLSSLRGLKELNLSGCSRLEDLREGLFDEMSFLEKLDLSKTNIHHLPSFANLTNLRALNISQTPVEEVRDLSNLVNLRDFFFADCHKLIGLQTLTNLNTLDNSTPPRSGEIDFVEERVSKPPSEFHLVSTFYNNSAFDQFKKKFGDLVGLIQKIHEKLNPNTLDTTTAPTTNTSITATNSETFACPANTDLILADLKYIRDNIDLLESSRNGTSVVELLNDLTKASDNLSPSDFPLDSRNLSQLHHTVVKLKHLVPPPKHLEENNEESNSKKKKKEKFTKRRIMRKAPTESDNDIDMSMPEMQNLSRSYDSLTDTQRNCLLYSAVLLHSTTSSSFIKERILIQLWYAEGLIDPQNVALSNANSTENPHLTPSQNLILDPAAYSNPNPVIMATSTGTDAKRVESPNTIEEIGRETLMVLQEKGFIERVQRPSLSFCFKDNSTRSFVRARAKAEGLFGFSDKIGKVTPHFCSLESVDNYTNSSEKLESFKTVRTLVNFCEPIVDIKAEWFSKMRNLCVLQLGRLKCPSAWKIEDYDHMTEVVDLEFLEELKNMKQLRLLSLEGFSTISKLPKSVCKLTNLKILNLRECSYLAELPAGIGSLKNLTHLDLTDCHILSMLPKGLRFLSKLEVLKGFVITYQIGGQPHTDACTLRELLNLEKLRKLNLVVNTEKFPNSEDVQVFKEMKNLCNLKITWEKNYNKDQESQDVVGQKVLRHSRWKQLRCWEQQTCQHETEEPSTSNPDFINLRKLVMRCFPLETAPSWLHPSGLQKLEKLYILGGQLTILAGDTNQMYTWNVKNLRLRYLPNLHMDWEELRQVFSNMTYCHNFICDIRNFPYGTLGGGEDFFGWKENEDV